jgi:hypothetical protein
LTNVYPNNNNKKKKKKKKNNKVKSKPLELRSRVKTPCTYICVITLVAAILVVTKLYFVLEMKPFEAKSLVNAFKTIVGSLREAT